MTRVDVNRNDVQHATLPLAGVDLRSRHASNF